MEISKDFDLDRLLEEKKILLVKPQIRHLWQDAEILSEYLKKGEERFGVPFEWGFDGICLHPVRVFPDGWWKLIVADEYCRLDYTDEASLRKGLDFCFDHWCALPDGVMFLPCGVWENGKEDLLK